MGCGSVRPYTKKEIETYINKSQSRLPSPELIDGNIIKLTTNDGFFNSSSLLDSTWLRGKITNTEYREAIEHINQRVAQTIIGASKTLSINQIPKAQCIILAVEELNAKYTGRVHFEYRQNEEGNSIDTADSFIYISFK